MDPVFLESQTYKTMPSIRFVVSDWMWGSRKGPDVFFLMFLVVRVKRLPLASISHGSSKTRPQLTMERKPDHAIGSLGLTLPHLTEIDPSPRVRIWDHAMPVPDAARSVKGGQVEACAVYDRMSHRVLYWRENTRRTLSVSLTNGLAGMHGAFSLKLAMGSQVSAALPVTLSAV